MRLTARPPWVAGSARNAKTASWHSPSLMLGVPFRRRRPLDGLVPPGTMSTQSKRCSCYVVAQPAPDRGRHDAITARAQAHPAQSRPLEGIPVGLGPARLRGVIAAAEHGDARCAPMTARG